MDSIEVIRKARAGSRDDFITLIRQHESFMYGIAIGILKSKTDTMDAIQETILLAYNGIGKLREPLYFRTWLTRILINECRRIFNHKQEHVPVEAIYEDQSRSAQMESNVELLDLLHGLDAELKEVVVLYYIEDLPVKEIAEILNISESNVKSRLHRARLKLALLLKEPDLKEVLP